MYTHMLSLFSKLARVARKLLPVAVLGIAASAGVLTAVADGPEFNNGNLDPATLRGNIAGESPSTLRTTVNANVGQTVNLVIWVHNNRPDTTALNTRARITLPTTLGSTHQATGRVSADNATAVTGATNIVVGSESRISYVPNSARLYKAVPNGNNLVMTEVSWPQGTNGNDVIGANGVNLGSINGCYQYTQAVLIQVRVDGTTPAIMAEKKVAKSDGTGEANAITANPNDRVRFRVYVRNTGNGTGTNTTVVDTLDAKLSYVADSSWIRYKENGVDKDYHFNDAGSDITFETLAGGKTKITWKWRDMAPTASSSFYLYFHARVADTAAFPIGVTEIPNTAKACFGALCANTNEVTITVTRAIDPVVSFTLAKAAANLGSAEWKEIVPLNATPGETIAFRLVLTNTGNTTATNVTLKDILPTGMTFVPGYTFLYNKDTGTNGTQITNDSVLVNSGYVFASVATGTLNQQTIVFRAKLADNVCNSLINTAKVFWNNAERAQDTAEVIVNCQPGLNIIKQVKNSTGSYVKEIFNVNESAVVTFRIVVSNTGNTTLNQVVARDVLPAGLTFLPGSLTVDGQSYLDTDAAKFFAAGLTLTNLTPNMSKTIVFQARVLDCPNDDLRIVNTAYAKAAGITEKNDTAIVNVNVRIPGF